MTEYSTNPSYPNPRTDGVPAYALNVREIQLYKIAKKIRFGLFRTDAAPLSEHKPEVSVKLKSLSVSATILQSLKNDVFWDINHSSYFTGSTLLLCYRAQPVNVM
jgi:hypothetical protein